MHTSDEEILAEISFRPIRPADERFLSRVYASTRAEEVAQVPDWTDEQRGQFLEMQFQAQHKFYQEQFTKAEFSIIRHRGQNIGRLYVDRRDDEIRLIDIALLPESRRHGFGGALLRGILQEARSTKKPVRIHVEKNNPALRLYYRLGFVNIEDQGVYFLMQWTPEESPEIE